MSFRRWLSIKVIVPTYLDDEPVIRNYEIIHKLWANGAAIKDLCRQHQISRSQYYEREDGFVQHGVVELFPEIKALKHLFDLQRLILILSNARPSLSVQAMLRVTEAIPVTQWVADIESISQILALSLNIIKFKHTSSNYNNQVPAPT
jgi:hypothetical protein